MLRYAVPKEQLPVEVLDKEIALIEKLGVKFKSGIRIGTDLSMEDLRRDFDAVFVAVGQCRKASPSGLKPDDAKSMGLEVGSSGITIDGKTYQTNLPGVFAGGDAVHKRKLTVRAVADGKEAAVSIGQYLSGCSVTGTVKQFNTRIGKLMDGEIEKFLACADKVERTKASGKDGGFTEQQARKEAARCLHCDCRKVDTCKLRQYAHDYGAKPTRYKSQRRLFTQQLQSRTNCHIGKDSALPEVQTGRSGSIGAGDIIYEAGKCIDCGLCIQTAARAGEELGLTFVGRGFDVRVAVPFDRSIAQALKHSADKCVIACPTGALTFRISL
jgi:ferredoxin